jgi:hypothetical protein
VGPTFSKKEGYMMISGRKSVFRVFTGILTATIFTLLSMGLLLPIFSGEAQAKDKIGWVGPVYKELSASLNKGFKAYYKKTYGKDVDITFVRPGGWPVCLDKVRISSWAQAPRRMKS